MKAKFLLLFVFAISQTAYSQTISLAQKTANVSSFAKLYGYVRYFHPSDEAAQLNWEEFVYYGTKQVENANSPMELKEKLIALFGPIAPSVQLVADQDKAAVFSVRAITPANVNGMKEISWQHYGLGGMPGLYKSTRTNKPAIVINPEARGYATATGFIDGKPYRGKKIRLRSSARLADGSGQGQMWLRVDKEDKKMGFFDNMQNRPIKKKDWAVYEISGMVDTNATQIVYGMLLVGSGKVAVDNFVFEVQEQDKWVNVPLKNASFEEGDDKNRPKDWNISAPGYLFELVSGEAVEGNKSLMIKDEVVFKTEEMIFSDKAKFGSYFKKELGNGLSCIVPLVLMGSESSTYPAADKSKLAELNKKIKAGIPEKQEGTDLYTRLSGAMMTWNVFEHFYPYKDEINNNWPAQLSFAIQGAYAAKNDNDYLVLLSKLTEKLKDGHVSVSGPQRPDYFSIPVGAALVEGQVVIDQVDPVAANGPETSLKPGDQVIAVDGQPVMEKINKIRSLTSGSPQWKDTRAFSQIFNGIKDSELTLKIKRDGAEKDIRLVRKNYRNFRDTVKLKKIEEGIYLINISTASMKDIDAKLQELTKAKGIICDLRGYPNGNNDLINYLLTVEDNNKWMFVPKIIYPDYEKVTYDSMGWELKPKTPHLAAKIIFLTGGGAISYAESYMSFIKYYKLATIVGQPTAGANGNVNMFTVPGNYTIRFTGMKVKQQDGSLLHGIGIQPDIFVNKTIKGVKEGRDEYMEKALSLLR